MKKYNLIYCPKNGKQVSEEFTSYEVALQRYYSVAAGGVDFIRIEDLNESSDVQLLVE